MCASGPSARGLDVIDDPGSLDGAARAGCEHLRTLGLTRAVVAHADLPWATDARAARGRRRAADRRARALPPRRRHTGPVRARPRLPFDFAYGPGSFRRHVAEARRRGYGVRVVRDPALAFDVDVPADLVALDRDGRFRLVAPVDA